ncbi:hypothetical protein HW450_03120 [Corynebacterium hindlerae]|uniref:Uncharacterized protein n=1 Tax=Corynebacterium hindlerae TaxID=699041 RepID=A0A7G5FGJ8_9CORY|nr:hypothetical protein [Corynebacterium hindlerae]QMV85739.1 hypothetical protein HW450_03120 [Corynebacterium hindlerae]QTH60600.1 hypothetical protein J5O04_05690 [Corynebacterium hindlerae]
MNHILIQDSPLRHTYPYGKDDVELVFGSIDEMTAEIREIFTTNKACRRVVVAVPEGDLSAIAQCEKAGMRYVLDVQLRDGNDVSLMVAEPDWVVNQPKNMDEMELK